jgi:endonuclease I
MKRLTFFLTLVFLLFTLLRAQIPPGYYNGTQGLYGEALKAALHDIIDEHVVYSYSDLRDFILPETDEDPSNPDNVILLYTGRSQAKSTFGGGPDDWNREHVWATSHGGFGTDPPCGTDAHMIRPADASVNSDRGNKDFDEGGQQHGEATACYFTEFTWEPRNEVKGDVARMILYMDVRYEGDNGEPDLRVVDAVNTAPAPEHGRLSTLLDWHEQDPPDAFEINRNNVIYSYQGNRNPFIDHPAFVYDIWGESAGIKSQYANAEVLIFPNPVINALHIKPENTFTPTRLFIYNIAGIAVIYRPCGPEYEEVDCGMLPAGLYVLRLQDEQSGKSYVSSFTKTD